MDKIKRVLKHENSQFDINVSRWVVCPCRVVARRAGEWCLLLPV